MQRRWFLSYHSPDLALAERLRTAIERKDPDSKVFFAPANMRAGGFWSEQLAKEIEDATGFILLVGERGVGDWQVLEYHEALEKRVKSPEFPLILMLLKGQTAPGLPFLRRLHWIVTPDPASEKDVGRLLEGTAGEGVSPGELWRYTSPYRGLAAMGEKDSDYFFGRTRETVDVIQALADAPDKVPILLGNSGVGKSSLALAGVLASLMRQSWPEGATNTGPWPQAFHDSRRWCFLTVRPGTEPVTSLVEAFLETWQLDRTSTEWPELRADWVDKLVSGKLNLRDLLDQTKRRYAALEVPEPTGFLLYIDQGEELYVRAQEPQRGRFSELVRQGAGDPRLHVLMSLRADFFGELQKDEALYAVHQQINVPPLREDDLREVVSQPAELLGARFETPNLAADIARRAAEESTKDAGALPLLSYLLEDMWKSMVEKGDGVLRLPAQSINLGRVLVDRANQFIARHPDAEDKLRRIFTLKLATVRENGEVTRRRAARSEFSDDEWELVYELADHPNRLLVTATKETSAPAPAEQANGTASKPAPSTEDTYAEVAHEAIFRRWEKLRDWITAEREFLAWRSGLEAARHAWENAPKRSNDALLMGFALRQARGWLAKRNEDIVEVDKDFINRSTAAKRWRMIRAQAAVLAAAVVVGAWLGRSWIEETWYRFAHTSPLTAEQEQTAPAGFDFQECSDCPQMVVVPAGTYMMGTPEGKGDKFEPFEHPPHEVTFAHPFAVSKFEVTFDEWDACVAHGGCRAIDADSGWGRGKQPVINVTWKDAQRYVEWLSEVTGKDYRLLTEAEWEYAARGGRADTYFSSGNDLTGHAWYEANSDGHAHAVDEKTPANGFALNNMSGNVAEWVEDCPSEDYSDAPQDGSAWTKKNCARRVIRGGSWQDRSPALRVADRDWKPYDKWSNTLGFRVGRSMEE